MAKVTRLTLDRDGGLERHNLDLREMPPADVPLDTVGQDLRQARNSKGEELSQVSTALKIRKDHLEAIEEGDMERLPGRAYAIGFVRSYAEYVGLDPAQCVQRLKDEMAGRSDSREGGTPTVSPTGEHKLPQGALVFAAVLLIGLAYSAYYLVASTDQASPADVTPVPDRLAQQAEAPSPAAPGQSVPASGALAPALPVGTPAAPAQPPAAPMAASPAPVPTSAAPAPAPAASEAALPQGQRYGTQNANSRIMLRIHKQVRVIVNGPNNRLFLNRLLKPGDTYAMPNAIGCTLTTADSGAVEIILDGDSKGFAGEKGVSVEALSLNPQDVADRSGRTG